MFSVLLRVEYWVYDNSVCNLLRNRRFSTENCGNVYALISSMRGGGDFWSQVCQPLWYKPKSLSGVSLSVGELGPRASEVSSWGTRTEFTSAAGQARAWPSGVVEPLQCGGRV